MVQIRQLCIWLGLIVLLGLLAYSNTFSVPFVFDDQIEIRDNYVVQQFDLNSMWDQYPTRFVPYLTFAANYFFHRESLFGYHLVNLLLHLMTSIGAFFLVLLLARSSRLSTYSLQIAGVTALLFVCHPIQTQAVTYIVQRITIMATLGYVFGLLFYVLARRRGGWNYLYIASFCFLLLAMLSKEISVTAPLMIVVIEFFFSDRGRFSKLAMLSVLPFLLLAVLIPTLLFIQKPLLVERDLLPDGSVRPLLADTTEISRNEYLLTQVNVIPTYMRLLVLPVNQTLDYDYPIASTFDLPTFGSALVLLAFVGLGAWLYPRNRLASFGIFFFLLSLSVESSVIPIRDVINEHRLYLPSLGFFLAVSSLVVPLVMKWASSDRDRKQSALLVLTVLILALTYATWQRNVTWASERSIWQDVVAKSPDNPRGYNNLGVSEMLLGRDERAYDLFNRAISLMPTYAEAYNNLGLVEMRRDNFRQATIYLQKAKELEPGYIHAWNNLGVAYFQLRNFKIAQGHFEAVLRQDPNHVDAMVNLAVLHWEQGNVEEAQFLLNRALVLDPKHEKALLLRSRL